MKPLGLLFVLLAAPASAQGACEAEGLPPEPRAQCEQGAADAAAHLAAGVPEWHWWGLPDHTTPLADSLLRARYGLRPVFQGDIVWDHEDHYTDAYNAVVEARLAPRFGDGFARRAFEDARRSFPGDEVLNPEVLRDVAVPPGACDGAERCFAVVRIDIAPTGEPVRLRVVRSPSAALDDSALAAAARARFRPAGVGASGRSLRGYHLPIRFADG